MGKLFGVLPSKGPNPKSRLFGTNGCACAPLGDRAKLGLAWDLFGGLGVYGYQALRSQTAWLELVRCTRCGRCWYTAIDSIEADAYMQLVDPEQARRILERDEWPATFNEMSNVWPESEGTKQEPVARLGAWKQGGSFLGP